MSAQASVIVSAGLSQRSVAGLACLVLLLAGCAGGSGGEDEGIPQLSLSPVSAASPAGSAASPAGSAASPAGSGSAREQRIAAGAEAIRAYRQMIFDIYADPNPNVQDMRKVAIKERLERDMQNLRESLKEGWKDTPGTVSIKWVKPVSIGGKEMRLFACVDPNGILTRKGDEPVKPAQRHALDYVLTLSGDRWLVSATFGHGGAVKAQPC